MEFKHKVTVRTRSKGLGERQVFQTEIVPNLTVSGKLLYKRMAQRLSITEAQARIYVDSVEGFILDELAQGNRVELGIASFYPRLSECVSARDADPVSDGAYVRGAVKARRTLMEAPRKTVEAVNELANVCPRIFSLEDMVTHSPLVIAPEHEIRIYGKNIPIVTSRLDEGVWLETRRSGRVASAEVLHSSDSEVHCIFHGELSPRSYTLVLGTRCGQDTDFKIRRCLWDVKVVR